jgi:hypothetical protein
MAARTEEQELTPQELSEIAGYESEPQAEPLVEPQYSLLEESGEVREVHDRGGVRLGVVGILVAMAMGLGWGFWQIVSPKPSFREPVKAELKQEPEEEQREIDQLKAELALQDQAVSEQDKPSPIAIRASELPPELAKKVQLVKAVKAPPPPAPVRRVTLLSRPSVPRPAVPFRRVAAESKSPADPDQRWKELSERGYASAGDIELGDGAMKSAPKLKPEETELASPAQPSMRGTIGQPAQQLSGTEGILSRTSVIGSQSSSPGTVKQVALGTYVRGTVTVPLIWSESASPTDGRFAVQLREDLMAADGTVVLAAGTVIVVQAKSVADSGLVSSEALAVIERGRGSAEEIAISEGAIAILGDGNTPLMAEGYFDSGGDIAKHDLLMGAIAALAKVGEAIGEPAQKVVVADDGEVIATTTYERPDLVAAALEGFFKPLSVAMSQRSETAVKELLSREKIAVLPQGKVVSILVKSLLTIEP